MKKEECDTQDEVDFSFLVSVQDVSGENFEEDNSKLESEYRSIRK